MPLSCLERDLDTMLSSADFGEEVGALRNGVGAPISGIFDKEDVEAQTGEGLEVLVPKTMFTCSLSKVPDLTEGETLLVRDVSYIIRSWQDTGDGAVDIFLELP